MLPRFLINPYNLYQLSPEIAACHQSNQRSIQFKGGAKYLKRLSQITWTRICNYWLCSSYRFRNWCSVQSSCEISQEIVPNYMNKDLELHAQVHCKVSRSRFRIEVYCHSAQNSFEMLSQVVAGCQQSNQGSCECNVIQYLQTSINFFNISDIGVIQNITEIQRSKNM